MFERAPGDQWRKFATMRAFYAFMWSHPGKQLLFMGTEFGQRREFSEQRGVDWEESGNWGTAASSGWSRISTPSIGSIRPCTGWTTIPQASPGSTRMPVAKTSSHTFATTARR